MRAAGGGAMCSPITSPSSIFRCRSSRLIRGRVTARSRSFSPRWRAICRAVRSSFRTANFCPASGRAAHLERSVPHENGGHGAAPLLQPRLDDRAAGELRRVSLEVEDIRLQEDDLDELLDADPLLPPTLGG